jgi:hypothetical protein
MSIRTSTIYRLLEKRVSPDKVKKVKKKLYLKINKIVDKLAILYSLYSTKINKNILVSFLASENIFITI